MALHQPDGYLAIPATGSGKPVLVLHPWWGLNDSIKAFTDQLAEAGFLAFAADLYHGQVTNQIEEAGKLAKSLDHEKAAADAAEALAYLKEKSGSEDGIAVIGFSLGGSFAVHLSGSQPDDVHSVVLYYGVGEGDFSQIKADFLGHFAENDQYEEKKWVDWLQGELKQAGCAVTFHFYEGMQHWFVEPDRADVYDADAASLAWERTVAFLNRSRD